MLVMKLGISEKVNSFVRLNGDLHLESNEVVPLAKRRAGEGEALSTDELYFHLMKNSQDRVVTSPPLDVVRFAPRL